MHALSFIIKRRKGVIVLQKVTIRSTDLTVNPIGLGTNAVGGQKYYPHITDEDGRAFLKAAIDHGVDFWDTAFTYGPKRSEEIIGEVINETGKRKEVVLATKASHQFSRDNLVHNNNPTFLTDAVYEALERLQTDYIDLFYIHFPDEDTPKYEAVGALQRLKEKGIIRAIGVSNFSLAQLEEANQDGFVNVYQGHYNLIEREAEKTLFPYTHANNISFVPYFPFASGLLAGKYTVDTTFEEGDLRLKQAYFQKEHFNAYLEKVAALRLIAQDLGVEVAQLVLAWYLHRDEIDVVIPGAKSAEQVKNNLAAREIILSNEVLFQIGDIFTGT